MATIVLRRAAIRALHFLADCPVPTASAQVTDTLAGIQRSAATADLLREMLAAIPEDLPGLRDRAILVVGFAGALRRAELAAVQVEHLQPHPRGLRLTLPVSKGERTGRPVTVALPYGTTDLCPVRAVERWQTASGVQAGPLFRRLITPPTRRHDGQRPAPVLGEAALRPAAIA